MFDPCEALPTGTCHRCGEKLVKEPILTSEYMGYWSAYAEEPDDEDCRRGTGRTQDEAVEDLYTRLEEDAVPCQHCGWKHGSASDDGEPGEQ